MNAAAQPPASTPPDEVLIARCASRTYRGRSPGLTRDDMLQEGRLAVWLAGRDGRIPAEPEHRRRYLLRRALGAMRDANRTAWRQQPMEADEYRDHDAPDTAGPEATLQLRELIALLARRASPRVARCIGLLAEGNDDAEVARAMGVSPSRVSQMRKEARRLVAALW